MKTIKQIADELGVDKQRIYRYVCKNHISDVHHDAGVMYITDVVESLIKQRFFGAGHIKNHISDAHHSTSLDAVISMLEKELEVKNEQLKFKDQQIADQQHQISEQQISIREITSALEHTAKSLHAAQALHAGTMQKQLEADSQQQTKENWFARLFKK